jgi:hypothetical protein
LCLLVVAWVGCHGGGAGGASPDTGTDDDTSADGSSDTGADTADDDADAHGDTPPTVTWRPRLTSRAEFDAFATPEHEVKFLARDTAGALPGPLDAHDCAFSDSVLYPFHIQFLRSLPGMGTYSPQDYASDTARRDARRFMPGSLYWFGAAQHPAGDVGVMAYTLSVASSEAPDTVAAWADYDTRLAGCVDVVPSDLVLVGVDPAQESWLLDNRDALAAAGVTVMARSALSVDAVEVYSAGEGYGYVNLVPPGVTPDDYGPRDILFMEAASDDIGLVSGVVTSFPQSFGSHLNLRLREKRLPNLRWSTWREAASVEALTGVLAHLVVDASGSVTLERAELAEAEAFWARQQPPLTVPPADLRVTAHRTLGVLRHGDASAFGVKAANLGEILVALRPPNRPDGFAIPFSSYATHMAAPSLTAERDALLADPRVRTDRVWRRARLDALRSSITRAPLPAGTLEAVRAAALAVWGDAADTTYLRFRSSTNAEDLEAFSGAGLYDSKTGCLGDDLDGDDAGPSRCLAASQRAELEARIAAWRSELEEHPDRAWLADLIDDAVEDLTEEKPAADALRKVWRSLWNLRAFDERDYYGIDHRDVYMGVAVIPTLFGEQAESVALTNLAHAGGDTGQYRIVTQRGEIGVVRPVIPGARPEEMVFVRDGQVARDFEVVARSSESPDADLWSDAQRVELASLLFTLHDHFAGQVYPHLNPLRLDVEVDVTAEGTTLVKQARPYLGELP